MNTNSYPQNHRRRGFTLVEVLVSSFLTLVIMGMLFGVLMGVISAWEGGTSSLKSSGDARFAMDLIKTDLESMVVRQTSFNQEWLFSGPYHFNEDEEFTWGPHPSEENPLLEKGPTFTWMAFFAPSLDRDTNQEGDIVSLSYRVSYQDPISTANNLNPIFGLYKAMTTTEEAFNRVMDFGDVEDDPPLLVGDGGILGYWTENPTPEPDNPAGFLAPNVVGFHITWWVRPAGGGDLIRANKNHYVRLSNRLVAFGPDATQINNGKIESAEVSMTTITDEGMRRYNFLDNPNLNQIIREFGRTHTIRIPIHY